MKSRVKIHQEAEERVILRLKVSEMRDLCEDWLRLMLVEPENIETPEIFFGTRLQSIKLDDMLVHRDGCNMADGHCDCGANSLAQRIVKLLYRERVREEQKRGGQKHGEE